MVDVDTSSAEYRAALAWFERTVTTARTKVNRDPKDITAKVVELTPELATVLLQHNEGNRNRQQHHERRLAEEMIEGDWVTNGESIIVSREGYLNDGAHRCRAVVRSGITFTVVMTFGVPHESRLSVDTNQLRRTTQHQSQMENKDRPVRCVEPATLLVNYEKFGIFRGNSYQRPKSKEVLAWIDRNSEIQLCVEFVKDGYAPAASRGIITACHYLFSQKNSTEADRFIGAFISGSHASPYDPAWMVRERLVEERPRTPFTDVANAAGRLLIYGWNKFREGAQIRHLRLPTGMPEIN